MATFSAAKTKANLREAFAKLASQLREEENSRSVWGIFWIFDGGNDLFYLYASRCSGPPTFEWKHVLNGEVRVQAFLNPAVRGKALLEDGSAVEIGEYDSTINAFLEKLAVEVMKEPAVIEGWKGLFHPAGCEAYLADDEVAGHKKLLMHVLAEKPVSPSKP